MPEGPEVHRQADRIDRVLRGRTTDDVWFAFPTLRRWAKRLRGTAVERAEARGKAFLIRFAEGPAIYVHLQLYGRWEVRGPRAQDPRTNRSLRLRVQTDKGRALLYSASEIDVLEPDQIDAHPYLASLGPDVLRRGLTAKAVRRRLEGARFRRRSLGALYLDQRFLGGVGNYLRSEILHEAGLRPECRPADLEGEQLEALARATLTLTRRSYRTGGITNDPDLAASLKAEGQPRRAYRFMVFGRDGNPCWTCGAEVLRTEVGGRRLYLCPDCQP
jgi:endonuclease-8